MYIGLSVALEGENYGMLLQTYATQHTLERMGHETEIIRYRRCGYKGIRLTPALAVYAFNRVKHKLKKHSIQTPLDDVHRENIKTRKRAAEQFRTEKLHNIASYVGNDQLLQAGKKYDAAIVGSDQLWLPDATFGNLRTLRFVPDKTKKISYATSLGVSEYPNYCKSSARQFLNRFYRISVREQQGKDIIQGICEKQVEVVVDPTYLLSKQEWSEVIPDQCLYAQPYVLCYFLGNNERDQKMAKEYAKQFGYKVVSILSNESDCAANSPFVDELVTGKGPEDFVNYIRGAACVFTDSFHGLCFSVINNKPFYIMFRKRLGVTSRNSRIENILDEWGLQTRLLEGENENAYLKNEEIDYQTVNSKIENKRVKSLEFLREALEG